MKMIAALALAAALLGPMAINASAQSSCSSWNSTCKARCKGAGAGCRDYCASQLQQCRQSGCWTQGAKFGGAKHCGLKK